MFLTSCPQGTRVTIKKLSSLNDASKRNIEEGHTVEGVLESPAKIHHRLNIVNLETRRSISTSPVVSITKTDGPYTFNVETLNSVYEVVVTDEKVKSVIDGTGNKVFVNITGSYNTGKTSIAFLLEEILQNLNINTVVLTDDTENHIEALKGHQSEVFKNLQDKNITVVISDK
jgi:UDP-N-acetylmuramoylalanine-D-glutamate ligase